MYRWVRDVSEIVAQSQIGKLIELARAFIKTIDDQLPKRRTERSTNPF